MGIGKSERGEINMDLQLKGKRAIVTGGSRGIGKAIAKELCLEGVDVAIAARNKERLEETAVELSELSGRKIVPLVVDTQDDEKVSSMVKSAVDQLGGVDILVNNAAQAGSALPPPPLSGFTDEHFWPDMNTKVLGYLRCAREVVPYMKDNNWGRIINISGLAARQANSIIGSMRNVSIVAMTKNLADELGKYGINVTVVHPGETYTERTPRTLENRARELGITVEEMQGRSGRNVSIGRIVDSSEVAYVVTFLCSPRSVAINGDVIAAGGGTLRSIYY